MSDDGYRVTTLTDLLTMEAEPGSWLDGFHRWVASHVCWCQDCESADEAPQRGSDPRGKEE